MPLRNLAKWLRWSNTRQAWQERIGFCAILAAALLLCLCADVAPLWLLVAGWASLGMLLAYFSRRGWLKLFGPVLFYDLIRTGRRTHFFAYRIVYLGILLALLCWIYTAWRPSHRFTQPVNTREAAELALHFFATFMIVQLVFIIVLTPAFTASAIAEEKERKTIEFILATDLRNREIIFGKLLSRMAMLSMFILAGLPVLSALQFLGGFSPRVMLVSYAGTLLTMVSLVSLTLLASVLARRTRDALFLVYLILLGFLGISVLADVQLRGGYGNSFPSTATWVSPLMLEDVLVGVRAGNPFYAVSGAITRSGLDEDALLRALGTYATFHGILTLFCVTASIGLVRRASLAEARVPRARAAKRWFPRPGLGRWPMVWKEVWAERVVKRRLLVGGGILLLAVLSFLPVVAILFEYSRRPARWGYGSNSWSVIGMEVNIWVRWVGTLVTLLGMAGIGVRAATSVRGEHDKDTMTSLLTTPLSSEEILFGKWLGSITSMRWFAVWLGAIWGVGVLLNGLVPFAVPLLAIATLCYAAVAASVGLLCSVRNKTSLRAILSTLLVGLLLLVGHWIPWICCIPFTSQAGPALSDLIQLAFQMHGAITPPVVLAGYLPQSEDDFAHESFRQPLWNPIWLMFIGFSGAALWGLLAWIIWLLANHRFKREGGRLDVGTQALYVPSEADRRGPRPHELNGAAKHVVKLRIERPDDGIVEDTDSTG